MQEVEAICDRVIIIDKGKIVAARKLDNLIQEETHIIMVEFNSAVDEALLFEMPNLVSAVNTHEFVWDLTFTTSEDMRATVFDFAAANNLKALQIVNKQKNLETIFREITK